MTTKFTPGTKVIWRNAGADIPATITACLGPAPGDPNGEPWYTILHFDGFASPSGVPESQIITDDGLDAITLDTVDSLAFDVAPAPGHLNQLSLDTKRFINILHQGGAHRFTQDLTAGAIGDKTVTLWSSVDEPLKVPPATGKENLYYSVNPTTVRVTDKDRAKYVGKTDSFIERYVASKNSTVAALNCLYADVDGKDFTAPTDAEVEAQYQTLRNDPTKEKTTDAALRNEALGRAKSAKYKNDPARYLALASAHVAQMTTTPSMIVASGGGFQCFWLFSETFHLRSDADRKRTIALQKRWVTFVGGDPGVCDIRRVLRLPGSINHKKAYAPNFPLVTFVKQEFDLRYDLADLESLLPATEPQPTTRTNQNATTATTTANSTPDAIALDVALLAAKNDSLVSLFNASFKVRDFLRMYGNTDHGDRMSRPGEPESKGIEIDEANNRSRHWSSNDPLYDPHWQTPFSIWCKLEFDNDFATARKTLIDGIFPDFHLWARTTSFEQHVHFEGPHYLGDSTDTKVFDSMLDVYEKVGGFGATVSKRIGGRSAGIGANTWVRSLVRMRDFFEVTVKEDHTYYVRLKCENIVCREWTTYALLKIVTARLGGPFSANDSFTPIVNEYSPRKADEPFLIGTSAKMKEQIQDIAQTLEITPAQAKDEYTFASLGESGLRVIDALLRAGDMTAKALAGETGKKMSSIRTAVHKLVQHGIVDASRPSVLSPYTYSLCADVWQRIDEIAPNLRTNTTSAQRENRRLKDAQLWCDRGIEQAKQVQDSEKQQRLERRKAKLAMQRIPHLARLLADKQLSQDEIKAIAYTPGTPYGPHPAIQAKLERYHGQARMDLAESRHKEQWETNRLLAENIAAFKATNTPKREWYPKLTLAGFTPNEAKRAIALGGVV